MKTQLTRNDGPILTVEPLGGLGNRMRALDSALALGREIDHRVHVVWYVRPNFNCRFERLFEVPDSVKYLAQPEWTKLNRLLRKSKHITYRWADRLFLNQSAVEHWSKEGRDFRDMANCSYVYIRTFSRFRNSNSPYRDFQPISRLRKMVQEITDPHLHMIGVHIRRTDNLKSVRFSPTEAFIQRMLVEINRDQQATFFVATDSPLEEERLRSRFPDRIVSHRKLSYDRNDPRAIEDALVDLYCLARCSKIIGSYWSSFTETACELGNAERIIIMADSGAASQPF